MTSVAGRTCIWLGLLALFLFGPAGAVSWPAAWVFFACYLGVVVIAFAVLDPALLRERSHPGRGFDRSDAAVACLGGVFLYPATLATCGADFAAGWTPKIPIAVSAAAFVVFLAGYGFALWAMRRNTFFSTFVRIQDDRGHHLIDTGPYAWVRHPGYTGTLAAHLALPIALGSLWGLIPGALGCVVFIWRTAREDQTLRQKLPGYREYCQRVRWRLAPGVW